MMRVSRVQTFEKAQMARHVDYYFSLSSPWAYIGNAPFHAAVRPFGVTIAYKPVPLGDVFSETGGLPLPKRHPARQRHRMFELQRWRERRGLKFVLKPKFWPVNAALADGVVIAIVQSGRSPEGFLARAFPAIWEEERNLAEADVLRDIADAAGLPGADLVAKASSVEVTQRYAQNQREAVEAGAFGSPAFVLDGEVFWGQDRIDFLADALKSGRAPYRAEI